MSCTYTSVCLSESLVLLFASNNSVGSGVLKLVRYIDLVGRLIQHYARQRAIREAGIFLPGNPHERLLLEAQSQSWFPIKDGDIVKVTVAMAFVIDPLLLSLWFCQAMY